MSYIFALPEYLELFDKTEIPRFNVAKEDIHWMNTPGPIFCGSTDDIGNGIRTAPYYLGISEDGTDIIFKHPKSLKELQKVWYAAFCDPWDGYSNKGNDYWDEAKIKVWYKKVPEILEYVNSQLSRSDLEDFETLSFKCWKNFLTNDLEDYLKNYLFFLKNGNEFEGNRPLPDLT